MELDLGTLFRFACCFILPGVVLLVIMWIGARLIRRTPKGKKVKLLSLGAVTLIPFPFLLFMAGGIILMVALILLGIFWNGPGG
jgi:hypothetical protein